MKSEKELEKRIQDQGRMGEFTDIYCELLTMEKRRNQLLKEKLDNIKPLLENGDLIIDVLKREIDSNCNCSTFNITLENIALALFEIEKRVSIKSNFSTHEPEVKPEPIESTTSFFSKIAKPDILKRYGTTSVWKPVLDFILDNVGAEFSRKDIIKQIGKYYKDVLLRNVSEESISAYVVCYVRYMKEVALIERCEDPNVSRIALYRLIKKPVEKKEPEPELKEKEKPVKAKFPRSIFDEEHLLKRYGTISVWKPVLDFILDNVGAEFSRKDIIKQIGKYYKTVLKRKVGEKSIGPYAGKYMKYMKEVSPPLIERCSGSSWPVRYKKIKRKARLEKAEEEKPEKKEVDDSIVQLPVEPLVKPEMTLQDRMSAPFKEVLYRYGNAVIYKEVYDHLLETLLDKFNYKNVSDSIDNIYKEKPKRELKEKTLETYTGRYIDYMKMKGKIEIDKKSGMFMISELPEKVKPPVEPELKEKEKPVKEKKPKKEQEKLEEDFAPEEKVKIEKSLEDAKEGRISPLELEDKPIELPEPKKKIILSKTAKDIYALAEKNNWARAGGAGIAISVSLIEERLDHSSDKIMVGLAELIKADLAWQRDPSNVKFKIAR